MSRTLAPLALTAGLMKPIAAWIRNAGRRRTLADLPDYLLRDIGLRRDQIAAALDGSLVADAAAAQPAPTRPTAKVIAIAPARPTGKPQPQGPLAA